MSRTYAEYRIRARPLLIVVAAGLTTVLVVLAVVYWLFAPLPDRAADTPAGYPERPAISSRSMQVQQIKSLKRQYLQSGSVRERPELGLRMPIDQAMGRVVQQYRPDRVGRSGGEP